jgi:hypothetical protein
MRIARFLFTIVSVGTLAGKLTLAEPSGSSNETMPSENREKAKADRSTSGGHVIQLPPGAERGPIATSVGKPQPNQVLERRSAARHKPIQPAPLHPDTKRANTAQSANATVAHPNSPGLEKSFSPPTEPFTTRPLAVPHSQPAMPKVHRPPAVLPLEVNRNRVAGVATLGGPAISKSKNSGVIDGTELRHKP